MQVDKFHEMTESAKKKDEKVKSNVKLPSIH